MRFRRINSPASGVERSLLTLTLLVLLYSVALPVAHSHSTATATHSIKCESNSDCSSSDLIDQFSTIGDQTIDSNVHSINNFKRRRLLQLDEDSLDFGSFGFPHDLSDNVEFAAFPRDLNRNNPSAGLDSSLPAIANSDSIPSSNTGHRTRGRGFQRVRIPLRAIQPVSNAETPTRDTSTQFRRLPLLPNHPHLLSSPNENPTARFQRIVNSALQNQPLTPNSDLIQPNPFLINSSPSNPLLAGPPSFPNTFITPPFSSAEVNDNQRRPFRRVRPNSPQLPPNFLSSNLAVQVPPIPNYNSQPLVASAVRRPLRKSTMVSRVRVTRTQDQPEASPALNFVPARLPQPDNSIQPNFATLNSYSLELPTGVSESIQPSIEVQPYSQPAPNPSEPLLPLADAPTSPETGRRVVRVRRPITLGSGPRRRVVMRRPNANSSPNRNPSTEDESLANNSIDGENYEGNFNANTPKQAESVVVDLATTFTYLTTVIKGQHTLFTSRMSTVNSQNTQVVENSPIEKGSLVIQPTETVAIGIRTRGATTTIVNVQSQVSVANVQPLSANVDVAAIQPTETNSLIQPTRQPVVEESQPINEPSANVLPAEDQLNQRIPLSAVTADHIQTEYTYYYTVYDHLRTRKNTRHEVVTSTLSGPLDQLKVTAIQPQVDASGYVQLGNGDGQETIALGKRVKSGSTTEVNLQLRTRIKLNGVSNVQLEVTPTVSPTESSVEKPSSSPVLSTSDRSPTLESSFSTSLDQITPSSISSSSVGTQQLPISRTFSRPSFSNSRQSSSSSSLSVSASSASSVSAVESSSTRARPAVRIRRPNNQNRPGTSRLYSRVVSRGSESISDSIPSSSEVVSSSIEPSASQIESVSSEVVPSSSLINDAFESSQPSESFSIEPSSTKPIAASSELTNEPNRRRIVTVRKPFGSFNRIRTRKPIPPATLELSSDVSEPTLSVTPKLVLASNSFEASSSQPSISASSSRGYNRYRLTSRVIKTKILASPTLISSIEPSTSSDISLSTHYVTSTHTIPYTIGSQTLFTTLEMTSSWILPLQSSSSSSSIVPSVSVASSSSIQPTPTTEMETRTMFTTYTYFTTFFGASGSSRIVSSEATVSNIQTVPIASPSVPSSSIPSSQMSQLSSPSFVSPSFSSVQLTPSIVIPSSQQAVVSPLVITETSEKVETSTILSTLTYFATLYNGTRSTITPIEEVRTELLTLKEPVTITKTINPLVASTRLPGFSKPNQPLFSAVPTPPSVFTRTYFTTYTNPVTLMRDGQPSITNVQQIVSNVITFTLPGANPAVASTDAWPTSQPIHSTPALQASYVTKTKPTTLTHFITLYSGSQTILSSIEEVSSTLVTERIVPSESIKSSSSQIQPTVSVQLPTSASPSSAAVPTTFTSPTTFETTETTEKETSPTTSATTVTLANKETTRVESEKTTSALNQFEGIDTSTQPSTFNFDTFTSPEASSSTTEFSPKPQFNFEPSTESSLTTTNEAVNNTDESSNGETHPTSPSLPNLFDPNAGKSTTVIDGSTVVFFTDFIFPSATDNAAQSSATETNHLAKGPIGHNINLLVDNASPYDEQPKPPAANHASPDEELGTRPSESITPIKPGAVLELSDLLGSSSIAAGSLSDTIKDIVQIIAANSAKQRTNSSKSNEDEKNVDVSEASKPNHQPTPALPSANFNIESSVTPSNLPTPPLENPPVAPTADSESTRYVTSVEASTRTLTLTTTKVYYTRDSPLTITSLLTTTIAPRTFVSTIIGSRTILGTAVERTQLIPSLSASTPATEEQSTTVTTTTLIFNSITTAVVRTLVLPSAGAIQPTHTVPTTTATKAADSDLPTTPPLPSTVVGGNNKRKQYVPTFKHPPRTTTQSSVQIKPQGGRTRAPFKPKPPTGQVPTRFATPKPKPVSTTTTTTTTTTEKPIETDQCRPACNAANKEICKDFSGIYKCDCRPGFARRPGSSECLEIQSYAVLLRVARLAEQTVHFENLQESESEAYQVFAQQTSGQVDMAYKQSSLRDSYIGCQLNWINQTLSGEGVYANFTLQLASTDGINEHVLQGELARGLTHLNQVARATAKAATASTPAVSPASTLEDDQAEAITTPSSVSSVASSTNQTISANQTNVQPIALQATVEALTDLDECGNPDLNDCGAGALCINTIGSYRCACVGGFADLQPSLPGRVCSAELRSCDLCNNRGDCIRESNGNIVCRCAKRYLGRNCEINGFMLTIMLPVSVIFAILTFCCVAYCCRKYRKRNNYSKGFKNMVNFAENNLSANLSASPLDQKAMLETSSESSEHFRHVYDGPGALLPDLSGSTRRSRSDHAALDIANLVSPGSRAQMGALNANLSGYAYGGQSIGPASGQSQFAAAAAAAAAYGNMPPQIVIPRARHPNQVDYSIHRGQVYMW